MSRRGQREDREFGSDSFLDIVANIVGILIILIVIAGVRVSRAPVASKTEAEPPAQPSIAAAPGLDPEVEEEPADAPVPPVPEPDPMFARKASGPPGDLPVGETLAAIQAPPAAEPAPVVIEETPLELPELPPLPPATPPQELVDRAAELEAELARLSSRQQDVRDRHAQLKQELARAEDEKDVEQSTLQTKAAHLRTETERLAELDRTLDETRQQLRSLRDALASVVSEEPPARTLKHHVTPVGREVNGAEIHFRLEGNRVAYVPLNDLAERLQRYIMRQREFLMRQERYEGSIGPVDGFEMRYVIARQPMSVLDELKYGQRVIRMGVQQWIIEPLDGLQTESLEQALRPGSRFYQALQGALPDATLTFWVYPDSFELHRELQEFAHANGFSVAARPLPAGVPITGSPSGSKSQAQ